MDHQRAFKTCEHFWSPPSALVLHGTLMVTMICFMTAFRTGVGCHCLKHIPPLPNPLESWVPSWESGTGLVTFTLEIPLGTFGKLRLTFRSHSAAHRDPFVTPAPWKTHYNYFGTLFNYRWWLLVCVWIQLIRQKARELNHDRITAVATTITIKRTCGLLFHGTGLMRPMA